MTQKATYQQMRAGYDQLAARLTTTAEAGEVASSPVKMQWAEQEGYKPTYNPNTDQVSWVKTPQPTYQQPQMMNLEGSMSPERLIESFPAYKWKSEAVDGVLQEIITAAHGGAITTQRAKEAVYQLALDTYKEAKASGKAGGAAKTAGSFEQAMSKATTKNGVAG